MNNKMKLLIYMTFFIVMQVCIGQNPSPDTIYSDAGGFKINLLKKGNPKGFTVLMENGLCGNADNWNGLNDSIAKTHTVVTYSRAFLGRSEKGNPDRNVTTVVRELRKALDNAQITGPYVLIGYSLGGLYVKAFAREYPKDIKGILLIDPLNTKKFYDEYRTEFSELYNTDMSHLMTLNMSHPCYNEIQAAVKEISFEQDALPRKVPTHLLVSSVATEIDAIADNNGQDSNMSSAAMLKLMEDNRKLQKAWVENQLKWASRYRNVKTQITDQCDHKMHRARIDIVLDAFDQLMSRISNRN